MISQEKTIYISTISLLHYKNTISVGDLFGLTWDFYKVVWDTLPKLAQDPLTLCLTSLEILQVLLTNGLHIHDINVVCNENNVNEIYITIKCHNSVNLTFNWFNYLDEIDDVTESILMLQHSYTQFHRKVSVSTRKSFIWHLRELMTAWQNVKTLNKSTVGYPLLSLVREADRLAPLRIVEDDVIPCLKIIPITTSVNLLKSCAKNNNRDSSFHRIATKALFDPDPQDSEPGIFRKRLKKFFRMKP